VSTCKDGQAGGGDIGLEIMQEIYTPAMQAAFGEIHAVHAHAAEWVIFRAGT